MSWFISNGISAAESETPHILDGKADVVFGSRFDVARPHRVLYYWHAVGNRFLTTVSNMFTNLNLSDMETCYKAFRREVLEGLTIEEDRFGFEPEITAKVAAGGWRLYEVGISYSGRTYAEGKKVGWRDGAHALRCIVRYARSRPQRTPTTALPFPEADDELADVLEDLALAGNYREWQCELAAPYLGDEILEVGAGHGTMTELFARHGRVTATDPSKRCVDILTDRFRDVPEVTTARSSLSQVSKLGTFDSVVAFNVLEHVEDDLGALREAFAALKGGGHLVLFVPALPALYSDFDRRIGHHRRYARGQLVSTALRAGFELVDVSYVNSIGALAWWIVAKRLGRTPTQNKLVRVYDEAIVPRLRRLEARRRPSIGQSLLCIARRPDADDGF